MICIVILKNSNIIAAYWTTCRPIPVPCKRPISVHKIAQQIYWSGSDYLTLSKQGVQGDTLHRK